MRNDFLWNFLSVYICFAMGLNVLLVPQFLKFCWLDLFPATRVLFPCTTSSIFALGSWPPRCYIATVAECLIIITRPKPATIWHMIYMCIIINHNIIIIIIRSLPPRCDTSFSSSHRHRCLHYHRFQNHHLTIYAFRLLGWSWGLRSFRRAMVGKKPTRLFFRKYQYLVFNLKKQIN